MRMGGYPGSFDPMALGHLDIAERGASLVDKLIIGVLENSSKKPMFTVEERVRMLREGTKHLPNVEVCPFSGLLVEFLKEHNATIVVRGLRAVTDFEYELQLAQANRNLYPAMETVFLTTNAQYSFISSTVVKDILHHGGSVEHFVPQKVIEIINQIRRNQHGSSDGN